MVSVLVLCISHSAPNEWKLPLQVMVTGGRTPLSLQLQLLENVPSPSQPIALQRAGPASGDAVALADGLGGALALSAAAVSLADDAEPAALLFERALALDFVRGLLELSVELAPPSVLLPHAPVAVSKQARSRTCVFMVVVQ